MVVTPSYRGVESSPRRRPRDRRSAPPPGPPAACFQRTSKLWRSTGLAVGEALEVLEHHHRRHDHRRVGAPADIGEQVPEQLVGEQREALPVQQAMDGVGCPPGPNSARSSSISGLGAWGGLGTRRSSSRCMAGSRAWQGVRSGVTATVHERGAPATGPPVPRGAGTLDAWAVHSRSNGDRSGEPAGPCGRFGALAAARTSRTHKASVRGAGNAWASVRLFATMRHSHGRGALQPLPRGTRRGRRRGGGDRTSATVCRRRMCVSGGPALLTVASMMIVPSEVRGCQPVDHPGSTHGPRSDVGRHRG